MAQKHKTITTTTKKKLNWMFPQLVEEFKYYMYGAYKRNSSVWKLSIYILHI